MPTCGVQPKPCNTRLDQSQAFSRGSSPELDTAHDYQSVVEGCLCALNSDAHLQEKTFPALLTSGQRPRRSKLQASLTGDNAGITSPCEVQILDSLPHGTKPCKAESTHIEAFLCSSKYGVACESRDLEINVHGESIRSTPLVNNEPCAEPVLGQENPSLRVDSVRPNNQNSRRLKGWKKRKQQLAKWLQRKFSVRRGGRAISEETWLNSRIDSETADAVKEVIEQHGGHIVLCGEQLEQYQARLQRVMDALAKKVDWAILQEDPVLSPRVKSIPSHKSGQENQPESRVDLHLETESDICQFFLSVPPVAPNTQEMTHTQEWDLISQQPESVVLEGSDAGEDNANDEESMVDRAENRSENDAQHSITPLETTMFKGVAVEAHKACQDDNQIFDDIPSRLRSTDVNRCVWLGMARRMSQDYGTL